jgi:hypothetical protein
MNDKEKSILLNYIFGKGLQQVGTKILYGNTIVCSHFNNVISYHYSGDMKHTLIYLDMYRIGDKVVLLGKCEECGKIYYRFLEKEIDDENTM